MAYLSTRCSIERPMWQLSFSPLDDNGQPYHPVKDSYGTPSTLYCPSFNHRQLFKRGGHIKRRVTSEDKKLHCWFVWKQSHFLGLSRHCFSACRKGPRSCDCFRLSGRPDSLGLQLKVNLWPNLMPRNQKKW